MLGATRSSCGGGCGSLYLADLQAGGPDYILRLVTLRTGDLIETSLCAGGGWSLGECWCICAGTAIESSKTRTKQSETMGSLRAIIYRNLT